MLESLPNPDELDEADVCFTCREAPPVYDGEFCSKSCKEVAKAAADQAASDIYG